MALSESHRFRVVRDLPPSKLVSVPVGGLHAVVGGLMLVALALGALVADASPDPRPATDPRVGPSKDVADLLTSLLGLVMFAAVFLSVCLVLAFAHVVAEAAFLVFLVGPVETFTWLVEGTRMPRHRWALARS